jgi:hypothetical protein
MGRFLAGSIAALMLVSAGLFWWQGHAGADRAPLIAKPLAAIQGDELPGAGDPGAIGKAPPAPPQADNRTREQKRFDRYDRNRDGTILRNEMMASRTAAFRKLDKDGNNLLSFEEWAVKTSDRFAEADGNKDGKLVPAEFAATAPKRKASVKPAACVCKGEEE